MLDWNLKGKRVFIAGLGDDKGFGWAIAKSLAEAGAEIIVGVWVPISGIFITSLQAGKFDQSRQLSNGKLMEFAKIYPMDAAFDTMDDVPQEIRENKRYKDHQGYAIRDVAEAVAKDFGKIDILIHSLANGPEVQRPLLQTSRKGYLAAISNSAYSFVSLVAHFGSVLQNGSALTLTYIASEKAIPGYGGGMSSAKAALESDTRTLAWEAGRKWGIRVNAISAGVYPSRAAKAISVPGQPNFIDQMIDYTMENAPLKRPFESSDVGHAATYLCSPLASAITGVTLYVDNGLHAMGLAADSGSLTQHKQFQESNT